MATIKPTVADVSMKGDGSTFLVTWTPLTEADTCAPVSFPEHSDKSIHASGTFGSASVAMDGSNNGSTYAPLHDPTGTAIAITSEGILAVLENTRYVAPVATGGTSQSLTIAMLFHFNNPMRT